MALPIALRDWPTTWVESGAVLQLVYLTPAADQCRDDERAYDLLVSRRGITKANIITARGINVARSLRLTERVWAAIVVVTDSALLGELLPDRLDVCGNRAPYELTAVHLLRERASGITGTLVRIQDDTESFLHDPGAAAGAVLNAVGSAASAVVREAGEAVAAGLSPLLPIAILVGLVGLWLWKRG